VFRDSRLGISHEPRQMARLMCKPHEATGMDLAKGIGKAIRRMGAGENPDKTEEEMGELLETEEPRFDETGRSLRQLSKRLKPPEVDETLCDL